MNHNRIFYILYGLLFVTGLVLLIIQEKGELVLWLNEINNPSLDRFFYYWTYVGDGWLFVPVLIIIVFMKYRYAITLTLTAIFSTVLVQLCKRILFHGMQRPKPFFEAKGVSLHFVEGVSLHLSGSFPSGHTATAFAVTTLLAYISRSKVLSVVYFAAALLVGVSRMYLCQHFLVDVFFGSLIGVVSTTIAIILVEHYQQKTRKRWFLNGRLLYK